MTDTIRKIKNGIKFILSRIDAVIMPIAAISGPTTGIYYLLKGSFNRELRSVLAGRLAYKKSVNDPKFNSSLLRRNVHRLEKGLLMRPRRVPFALNYIERTVNAYVLAMNAGIDPTELSWAHDVLQNYMDVTPPHPLVDKLRATFENASAQFSPSVCDRSSGSRIPYVRPAASIPQIDYDEFLKLAQYRRSVRWFLPKSVPRDLIGKAVDAAAYAPTACNRQPYEFRIFDTPELVAKAISIPMGTAGFAQQVPAVAVVVGRQRNYFSERDRHLIYVDSSLASMSFVFALEVQGLSSCCINWPDIESLEKRMEKFLRLAPDERPIMLIAFGYPDPEGLVANSTKKSAPTICKFNFEHP